MCAPVIQGYGLTETCAASFIGIPDDVVRRHDSCSDQDAQFASICKRSSICMSLHLQPAGYLSFMARQRDGLAVSIIRTS